MQNKLVLFSFCLIIPLFGIVSQEALKSTEESYYDFLSLQGIVERPALNYRTLSDSVWTLTEEAASGHVWSGNNLGTRRTIGNNDQMAYKIYGPEWYNSFNTAAPYGQNDGALWQGKGYNTSLTAGARLEAYGIELTIKPQICFQQNLDFDIMSSAYDSPFGYFWGYTHNVGVDAPQRFGDKPFWTFDWGDTEIRYTWKTLTIGFGTQAIWLGPAEINPLLHSNNAPTYPKLDIGLRRQRVVLPWLGWYIGDVEAHMWIGRLTESDYFTSDNSHNLYNGFSFSYAPSFLPGLTLGANKVCLSKWGDNSWKYLNPFYDANDAEDQKASVTASWLFPQVGFEVYGEIGIDDYSPDPDAWMYRTMSYTVGLKKAVAIYPSRSVYGEIIFEWTNTEMTQDFQFDWAYNFGFHHLVTQGYTNRGQYIGIGTGYGSISQYLRFNVYYPKGCISVFLSHANPDTNYVYKRTINTVLDRTVRDELLRSFKCVTTFGITSSYYVTSAFAVSAGFCSTKILHPTYTYQEDLLRNFTVILSAKHSI